MKLSTRTYYKVHVLPDLKSHRKGNSQISLKEILETSEVVTDPVECLVNTRIYPRSRLCAARDNLGRNKNCQISRTCFHDLKEFSGMAKKQNEC